MKKAVSFPNGSGAKRGELTMIWHVDSLNSKVFLMLRGKIKTWLEFSSGTIRVKILDLSRLRFPTPEVAADKTNRLPPTRGLCSMISCILHRSVESTPLRQCQSSNGNRKQAHETGNEEKLSRKHHQRPPNLSHFRTLPPSPALKTLAGTKQ